MSSGLISSPLPLPSPLTTAPCVTSRRMTSMWPAAAACVSPNSPVTHSPPSPPPPPSLPPSLPLPPPPSPLPPHHGSVRHQQTDDVDVASGGGVRQSRAAVIAPEADVGPEGEQERHDVGVAAARRHAQRWRPLQGRGARVRVRSRQQQQPTHLKVAQTKPRISSTGK